MVTAFAKPAAVYNSSRGILRKDSKSFFLYVFIYMKEIIVFVDKKELELLASRCFLDAFFIHRENLGGYLGLIIPFDSFFDTRADTAFMRDVVLA